MGRGKQVGMSGEYSPASSGPAWHDVLHTLANPIVPHSSTPISIAESASPVSQRQFPPPQLRRWSATTSPATHASGGPTGTLMSQRTTDPRVYRPKTMRSPMSSPASLAIHKATPFVPRLMQSPRAVSSKSARQAFLNQEMEREAQRMQRQKDVSKKRAVTDMIANVPWKNPTKRVKSGRAGQKRAASRY